ncbi:MAG: TIR domain-containing protein [Candidatus Eisenbacteria bacterium]|nr:TIR domain-containing protein [Candidatus Eisenbacteria bacterium]
MGKEEPPKRKVFVSYSWTSPEHQLRVVSLAERLVGDGVDVSLDRWDLREGQDKYAFMEQMVTDPSVDKVLVLADSAYADKADGRRGGVGTETQIISKEVYDKAAQTKFIPVVLECDEVGKPCLPAFLASRIYIDMSSPEMLNKNYEALLRCIFDRPALQKPKLGVPPPHLFTERAVFVAGGASLDAFKRALREDKSNYVPLAKEYLEAFAAGLEAFRLTSRGEQLEADFLASIHDMIPARNELIDFYDTAFGYKDDPLLMEAVLDFLEICAGYHVPVVDRGVSIPAQTENFAFFTHELFIYLTAVLIRHKRDSLLDALMSHSYYIEARAPSCRDPVFSYTLFRSHSDILQARNEKLERRRLVPEADLIKERATLTAFPFRDLIQADFVLWLRSILHTTVDTPWFPVTLVFVEWSRAFPLFARAVSDKGFERIARIHSISSRAELKEKYEREMAGQRARGWAMLFRHGVRFNELMNFEQITGTAHA